MAKKFKYRTDDYVINEFTFNFNGNSFYPSHGCVLVNKERCTVALKIHEQPGSFGIDYQTLMRILFSNKAWRKCIRENCGGSFVIDKPLHITYDCLGDINQITPYDMHGIETHTCPTPLYPIFTRVLAGHDIRETREITIEEFYQLIKETTNLMGKNPNEIRKKLLKMGLKYVKPVDIDYPVHEIINDPIKNLYGDGD